MTNTAQSVQEGHDLVANAYAHHYADELQHKPLDREYAHTLLFGIG